MTNDLVVIPKEELAEVMEKSLDKVLRSKVPYTPEWMTFDELCHYLNYSKTTVQRWIDNRSFPVSKKNVRPRFNKFKVDEWMLSDL